MNAIELAAELRDGSKRGTDTCLLAADMLEELYGRLVGLRKEVEKALDASQINLDSESDDYGSGFDHAHSIFYQRVMNVLR
ncbi:hypothetical protein TSH7_01110 [Azospirillum sp. TSH7]|uniref:hypothetical protein n=1 Tax=unclassified Azospirillum TaxID=2630922 RepID=UPI000D614379|nr:MULTISPECIES: hypothetical protein [unclassified Azospirillum]PWC69075.1 hypothetical protein TSH7_01110 [Azospirillum sp. TSH7]PWC71433.1 hypothetical protein TSH20_03965 [Azospirillum sp. TSH20]